MSNSAKITISCRINQRPCSFETYPMTRLIDLIRDDEHFTGTKEGCGEGECGACSVLMNGELVNSCLVPAVQVNGADIITIEGIIRENKFSALQEAFVDFGGVQCGICTPGMVMATVYLLGKNPNPTEAEIREAIAGNICRCTGYTKIFEAIQHACGKLGALQ
ncbi:MAG TPA: ferredoxin [Bdellovibrionales bacterium]|nr:MAG: hypothetical protein A2Z97_15425 [Bdellovibrionales bacterium GWB1_52_6]OFZ04263.1 MAG: hypothetical protein A2X97_06340 [Bdellovibrionales bacterium GWA1_52_35]OFZ42916.1 MAG: hypothetical protein A2070_04615 [Bdellovibrionales bacterium GWC1_52_8]HAR42428.1 ferredoxin [Bdellovibrionales bacterium]HCM40891.1 ferredoxin [Bdellovibrionales bacterium]